VQRLHPVVVGLVFVTACAANEEVETTFDPCSPLEIVVTSDHVEDVEAVKAALAAWARVVPVGDVAVTPGTPAAGQLTVRFLDGEQPVRGMYYDSVGLVEISRDMLAPEVYPIAVAHELGHAFGLLHVEASTRASVMNVGNTTVEPTEQDAIEVIAKWASCRAAP